MAVLLYIKKCCNFCMFNCHKDTHDDAKWPQPDSRKTVSQPPSRNTSFMRTSSSSIDIRASRDASFCQGSFLYSGPSSSNAYSHQRPLNSYISSPNIPPLLKRVPSVSDAEFTMPEMNQCSGIATPYQISSLFLTFPPRLRLYPWTLMYSLKKDGCSLANLYSRLKNYDHTLLLIIVDTKRTIFGAVLSPPSLKLRGKTYYGTCETFVFTFYPRLQKYHASGENNYFIMGMPDGITIGGWLPALWLDSNLERGTTSNSPTFDNLPLTDESFTVRDIECWALAEPEYMEDSAIIGSIPIYTQFESSLLAEKKPEKEVGGVRCGRKARFYQPKWKPEASGKKIFKLGEESEEEEEGEDEDREREDVFGDSHFAQHKTPRNMHYRGESTPYNPHHPPQHYNPHHPPQHHLGDGLNNNNKRRMQGGSIRSPIMAAAWAERYR
eukprot:TRINITY_DN9063_c0_g1_i1.p1 TRINITY_DN9063_c0_g1~~TRINITY_DN9063_c0_g1_i1.p1  ORF type:complete len:438 (+),score=86.78 TRINITY_DN9063_c0_g1_i1:114-1427(+)